MMKSCIFGIICLALGLLAAHPATAKNPSTPGVIGTLRDEGSEGGDYSPTTHGFGFANYGNDEGYENLTAVEVERIFGADVCEEDEADHCILTPAAHRWMTTANEIMAGGHCQGMAVLSLRFDLGMESPSDFGAGVPYELKIQGNHSLQRELAVWFSTQLFEPFASDALKGLTPSQVVDRLAADFNSGRANYTVGIYQPDGSEGHAITPYAVVDKGDGIDWIMVYDNNFPGQERHIEVHRSANSWTYFTAANPNEEGEEYTGNAGTGNLELDRLPANLEDAVCPFCGDVDAPDAEDTKGAKGSRGGAKVRQIVLDGDAHLLITDDKGKRLGHANGKLVNEIPSAKIIKTMATYRDSQNEPIYELPDRSALKVTLDGTELKKKEATDMTMFGRGYTLGVYDLQLEPGERDTIEFSADDSRVVYTTDRAETPELEINFVTKGADYEFDVSAAGESGGQRLELGVDLAKGTFSVKASAHDGQSEYSVSLHRYTAKGEQVFEHKGIDVDAKERLVFNFLAWKGNKEGMKVGIDHNDDGSVEEDETLSDEE